MKFYSGGWIWLYFGVILGFTMGWLLRPYGFRSLVPTLLVACGYEAIRWYRGWRRQARPGGGK